MADAAAGCSLTLFYGGLVRAKNVLSVANSARVQWLQRTALDVAVCIAPAAAQ